MHLPVCASEIKCTFRNIYMYILYHKHGVIESRYLAKRSGGTITKSSGSVPAACEKMPVAKQEAESVELLLSYVKLVKCGSVK